MQGLIRAVALALALCHAGAALAQATVAVRFDRDTITVVEESGLADPATGRRVTADDPVRIASVSKLVVALGVMRLVEQGKLSLDRDVSNYLGWELRNPAFPRDKITLRMLFNHRSSLTDKADYVIPLGDTVRRWVSNPVAWDAQHRPGTYFRYTNLNFPVIASAMEKVTGERFDRLMDRLVIKPLGLKACFNWAACDDATLARAVVLADQAGAVLRDDLKGQRPACPVVPAADGSCDLATYRPGDNGALFSPQGGLRISARDLARIAQAIIGDDTSFLSRRSVRTLGDIAVIPIGEGEREGGFYCSYGLAIQRLATQAEGCRDDPFGSGRSLVGHAGEAYGLRSGLWFDLIGGIAYFTTAVPDDAPRGRSAFTAAEEAVITRTMAN